MTGSKKLDRPVNRTPLSPLTLHLVYFNYSCDKIRRGVRSVVTNISYNSASYGTWGRCI